MEATVSVGELRRMVQFKEKGRGRDGGRSALFTYPALMAADILAYDTDLVPVGGDQRQHLELARTLSRRFNAKYGETFVVPGGVYPQHVARVMDLVEPAQKMGKTGASNAGLISLLDPPLVVERKISRATTDSDGEIRYAPGDKPGLSNLLAVLGELTGTHLARVAEKYASYAELKRDAAAAVISLLEPVQRTYVEVRADGLDVVLRDGAERARAIAEPTLDRASRAIGLVPSS